jgi:hypothetical protein
MSRYQEDEINFRCTEPDEEHYPVIRGLTVYTYGGDLETTLAKVREQLQLGPEWRVVKYKDSQEA